MRDTHYLKGDEPLIAQLTRAAFPDYHGSKFKLDVSDHPLDVRSYWSGGSRSYFVFVDLATLERLPAVPAQSEYDRPIKGADRVDLPPGVVCIEHTYFTGRDLGITIHVHPRDLNPTMLPARVTDLTTHEMIVLRFTASRKASYAGISQFRLHEANRETGITREEWEAAKATLIARGLLTKIGGITPAGRNEVKR